MIAAINTEVATNVGVGGSLFALLPEFMREELRGKILPKLEELSRQVMKAVEDAADNPEIRRLFKQALKEKLGAMETDEIGEDIFGTSYAWPPFLLLDWLIEPVFARGGRRVDGAELVEIKPVYGLACNIYKMFPSKAHSTSAASK